MRDVTLTPPLRSVMLFTPLALVRYILSQLGLEDRWLDGVWLKYVSCRFQSVTGKRHRAEFRSSSVDSGAYFLEMLSLYDCSVPCYNNRIL